MHKTKNLFKRIKTPPPSAYKSNKRTENGNVPIVRKLKTLNRSISAEFNKGMKRVLNNQTSIIKTYSIE